PSSAIRIPYDIRDFMNPKAGNGASGYSSILRLQKRAGGLVWDFDKNLRPAAPDLPRTGKPIRKLNFGNLATDLALRPSPFCDGLLLWHFRGRHRRFSGRCRLVNFKPLGRKLDLDCQKVPITPLARSVRSGASRVQDRENMPRVMDPS